jgi:hypothetical protein
MTNQAKKVANKSNSKLKNLISYTLIGFIAIVILLGVTGQLFPLLWVNIGRETVSDVKISQVFPKIDKGDTKYLVTIEKPDGKTEVLEIENNFFLFRLDRTSVFADLGTAAKEDKCATVTSHGWRLPSVSFRGLTNYQITSCKSQTMPKV